jgi:type IV pilus assembly protein PilO
MAKSFHELSPRAQTIVFVLLSALTVGAAWQVLLGPQQTELTARRVRLGELEGELVRAQAVAARLPAAEREVRALEASLRETQAVIPDEKDPQDVLRSLHSLASESLLDIATFKPKPIVTKSQYSEWPIELGLEGGYHDLGRFFDRIASMPRLMSVADLQIKTKTKANGRGTVAVSCVATTFVFQKDLMTEAVVGGQP